MRRHNGSDALNVIDSNGADVPPTNIGDANLTGRGVRRLAAGTYYVPLGGQDAKWVSAMTQWDGEAVITTITVQETDAPVDLVSDFVAAAGNWLPTPSGRITASANGAGTTTTTGGVLAHTAAGAGAGIQNIQDSAARRMRLEVVVGTAGEVRFFGWGED